MNKKSNDFWKKVKLYKDEQAIEDSITEGSFMSAKDLEKVKLVFSNAAKRYKEQNKSQRITLRINVKDLEVVKDKAQKSNLPYQTLLGVLIRKYVDGETKLAI